MGRLVLIHLAWVAGALASDGFLHHERRHLGFQTLLKDELAAVKMRRAKSQAWHGRNHPGFQLLLQNAEKAMKEVRDSHKQDPMMDELSAEDREEIEELAPYDKIDQFAEPDHYLLRDELGTERDDVDAENEEVQENEENHQASEDSTSIDQTEPELRATSADAEPELRATSADAEPELQATSADDGSIDDAEATRRALRNIDQQETESQGMSEDDNQYASQSQAMSEDDNQDASQKYASIDETEPELQAARRVLSEDDGQKASQKSATDDLENAEVEREIEDHAALVPHHTYPGFQKLLEDERGSHPGFQKLLEDEEQTVQEEDNPNELIVDEEDEHPESQKLLSEEEDDEQEKEDEGFSR